jgi:hypothetical protein
MKTSHENAHRFIEKLRAEPSHTHPQDLSDWGARAAVEELLENWEPALREESTFEDVIGARRPRYRKTSGVQGAGHRAPSRLGEAGTKRVIRAGLSSPAFQLGSAFKYL